MKGYTFNEEDFDSINMNEFKIFEELVELFQKNLISNLNDEILTEIQKGSSIKFIDYFVKFSKLSLDDFTPNDERAYPQLRAKLFLFNKISKELDDEYFEDIQKNKEKIFLILTRLDRVLLKLKKYKSDKVVIDTPNHLESMFNSLANIILDLWDYNLEFKSNVIKSDSEKEILRNQNIDKRVSTNAPTNIDKIKALKLLAPELWSKLEKCKSKEIQQNVINLITGVNLEDSYKYSFGSRQKEINTKETPKIESILVLFNK